MTARTAARALNWLALLLVVLSGSGCVFAYVRVHSPSRVSVPQGDSARVTVTASGGTCDAISAPDCVDLSDRLIDIDYEIRGLPPGVRYSVDHSLRSPSTPSLVRLTLEAADDAPPGWHHAWLFPVLAGHDVGGFPTPITVKVLATRGAGSSPGPTAPIRGVAAGAEHSLAVLTDGTVWGWGRNSFGQLGFYGPWRATAPVPVPGVTGALIAAGGGSYSLALIADGSIWGWGLMPPLSGSEEAPGPVPGLNGVRAIAAGARHALALLSDGTVRAWGKGETGALGDGTLADRSEPVPVAGLTDVHAIAAGNSHSLALTGDGGVWIWGNTALREHADAVEHTAIPVPVAGLAGVRAIASGREHALALLQDGTVRAWGANFSGQLGDGTLTHREGPVEVVGLDGVQAIAAGEYFSLALRADGTVWAWGTVGPPRLFHSQVAVRVPALDDVRAIAAGGAHALALSGCGQLWTWGGNGFGQLGDGTYRARWDPIPLITPGDHASCPRVVLDVAAAGDGEGRVESSGGEVSCDAVGCTDFLVADRGTVVTLNAVAGAGTTFRRWVGDCEGPDPQTTVVMDESRRCTAMFRATQPELFLLSVVPGEGHVTSSGGGLLGPEHIDCGIVCHAIFTENTAVTLTAHADGGVVFVEWSGDCVGTDPETMVIVDRQRSCTARFRPFQLTVEITGGEGRVVSDPPGLECEDLCTFAPGGATTLIAVPAPGWQFDGWGGDCAGAGLQQTVAMEADTSCSASFSRAPGLVRLTVIVEGTGSVMSVPAGIDCPDACVGVYPLGTVVELTAVETEQSMVLNWFDDCAAPGVPSTEIVMDSDKTCRVQFGGRPAIPVAMFTFEPGPHPVGRVITFDGSASHVLDPVTGAQDPGGITVFVWDFQSDGLVDATGPRGTTAIVQHAFQAPGLHSVRLRVRGGPFDDAADRLHDVAVVAATAPLFGLTVQKAGDGGGTIATVPPGVIGCGPGCTTAGPVQLEEGTVVTLAAQADAGSQFAGWSGAGCTSESPSVSVVVTSHRSCTATFVRTHPTLTVVVDDFDLAFGTVVGEEPPGNPINCGGSTGNVCVASFPSGTEVVLRPNSAIFEFGYSGVWSGCDAVGFGFTCTVAMTGDRAVRFTISP